MIGDSVKNLLGLNDDTAQLGKMLLLLGAINEGFKDFKYERKKNREEDEGLFS